MKYLILILTILNTLNVSAQFKNKSLFTPGVIITKNDTIKCFIEKYINYNSRTIKYKINKNDAKALKIKSSTVIHLKLRVSKYDRITIEKKSYLMENLKRGTISLYSHTSENVRPRISNNNINNNNTSMYYLGNLKKTLYFVGKGKTIKLKKKKYKQDLKYLMSDNIEIQSKIDKLQYNNSSFEFNLRDLISIYNYWFEYKKNKN